MRERERERGRERVNERVCVREREGFQCGGVPTPQLSEENASRSSA